MKKIIKILVGVVVVIIIGLMVFKITINLQNKKKIAENLQMLPNIKGIDVASGRELSSHHLEDTNFYLLLYFSTNCEYCNYEAEQIISHYDIFKNSQVLLFSVEPLDSIKNFAERHSLNTYPNFHVIKCEMPSLQAQFGKLIVPTLFIYDKNKKLIKRFDGEVMIDAIAKYIAS